ncbi:toprim domain-containing protein [Kribbella sp. VKM Ac-2568]|uniref:toprim domain-containing protein n=1 Tax=Kribbella sp. VKM Ac-2568 TaxID=2512219 RepID=UPI0010527648
MQDGAGVAVAGTRLSVEQSNLLSHNASSDIVIVATDGDTAGRSAAIRWLGPLSTTAHAHRDQRPGRAMAAGQRVPRS